MEYDRPKKRNKEEDKRHQITAGKGTTIQTRYSTLDKEVKRKSKVYKRAFIENLADEAETAAHVDAKYN